MKRTIRLMLTVFVLFIAASAHAAIYQKDPVDGYTCADNMTTGGCFSDPTMTAYGPSILTCKASSTRNQRCRDCIEYIDKNGQPQGYLICGYVPYSSGCECTWKNSACQPNGTCSYI